MGAAVWARGVGLTYDEGMNVLVLSCSMNPVSRSVRLAQRAVVALTDRQAAAEYIDLREGALPLADGDAAHGHAGAVALADAIRRADAVILAVPVYNYYANAAAKNVIELTGRAWTEKVVGFLCAAGGHGSYMSVMSLANSLMLDFRCLIVPRFVYATKSAFREDGSLSEAVEERIDRLCDELVRLTRALAQVDAETLKPTSPGGG